METDIPADISAEMTAGRHHCTEVTCGRLISIPHFYIGCSPQRALGNGYLSALIDADDHTTKSCFYALSTGFNISIVTLDEDQNTSRSARVQMVRARGTHY